MAEYKWEKMDSLEKVVFPPASIGACKNSVNCKAYNVDLADGWCVKCWDRGLNTSSRTIGSARKRRVEEKRLEGLSLSKTSNLNTNRIKTRGRHIKGCTCDSHKKKGFTS